MRGITSLCFLLGLPLFYKAEERRLQTILPCTTFNCVLLKYKYPLAYSSFTTMFILCYKQKRRRPYFSLTWVAWGFLTKLRALGKRGSRDEECQSRGEPGRKTTEKTVPRVLAARFRGFELRRFVRSRSNCLTAKLRRLTFPTKVYLCHIPSKYRSNKKHRSALHAKRPVFYRR